MSVGAWVDRVESGSVRGVGLPSDCFNRGPCQAAGGGPDHAHVLMHDPVPGSEVGNELFWYLFKGEPEANNGYVDLNDDVPGLGLELDQESLVNFHVIE
jgi:hypothetical protein